MNAISALESEWSACFDRLKQGEFFRRLSDGTFTENHYRWFLRECFHNVYLNPKLMALFIAHLHSGKYPTEAKLLKHAAMEIGHHELALADYVELGGDAAEVRGGRALPTTESLAAFIAFQVQHRNPLSLLGYIYHLEALPARIGAEVAVALARVGIPATAMTFLNEHTEADAVHVKWEREYMQSFIANDSDFEAVVYGLRGSCEMHGIMLQGVMDQCRDWRPVAAAVTAAKG